MDLNINLASNIISTILAIVILIGFWKVFVKAGEAGWKILIPLYSTYILFKIVYGNGWKFLLLLVPVLDVVITIAFIFRLSKVFGKGIGFGFLMLFFSPIMICVLGFGNAQYIGPVNSFI